MPLIKYKAIIRARRDSYATWSGVNPVLNDGEVSYVSSGENAGKIKVGNGNSKWMDLPFIKGDVEIADNLLDESSYKSLSARMGKYLSDTKAPINTTLADENESAVLPAVESASLTSILQVIRNNLKSLFTRKANLESPVFTGLPQVPSKQTAAGNNPTYIATEVQVKNGDDGTLQAAKSYTDQAQLATQTWLEAVDQKTQLPITGLSPKINYLCRVIADTNENNGVYQAIAGWTGSPSWTFFSDNQDWIDETELQQAIAAHNVADGTHQVTLASGSGSDVSTPAESSSTASVLQKIWNKIKALVDKVNSNSTALAGKANCSAGNVNKVDTSFMSDLLKTAWMNQSILTDDVPENSAIVRITNNADCPFADWFYTFSMRGDNFYTTQIAISLHSNRIFFRRTLPLNDERFIGSWIELASLESPVFTGTPKLPAKTSAATNDGTLPATEAQVKAVNDSIPNPASLVQTSGTQTIAGQKTFSTMPYGPNNRKMVSAARSGTTLNLYTS